MNVYDDQKAIDRFGFSAGFWGSLVVYMREKKNEKDPPSPLRLQSQVSLV